MPDNPFGGLTPLPDAGKNTFNEPLYLSKFLRKTNLRTYESDWYVYDGKAWRPVKKGRFGKLALALLPESIRAAKHGKAIIEHAEMKQSIGADEEFLGAVCLESDGVVLVNVNNGILRVTADTVALLPHDKDRLLTGHLKADWKGEWKPEMTPLFNKALEQSLPHSEDRALQQWFAGYTLNPSCAHEVCLISYGNAGTGKSTISDAVMNVIGPAPLKTVLSMAQLCAEGQGAYSLPSLQRALVNMGTELDTVDIGDSSNFKRLVSGEPVEVRPIYGSPYTMMTTTKLWFNSNALPRFRHGTDAELRRVRFLNFTRVVDPKNKDVRLKEKLASERDGILSWMIQGLQAILAGVPAPEGGPESVRMKAKFAISNDPVRAFAKECLTFGPEEEVKKDDFYNAFDGFLGAWGFGEKSKQTFFRQFYERYPEVNARHERTGTVRDKGRWVLGVSLREEDDE